MKNITRNKNFPILCKISNCDADGFESHPTSLWPVDLTNRVLLADYNGDKEIPVLTGDIVMALMIIKNERIKECVSMVRSGSKFIAVMTSEGKIGWTYSDELFMLE